MHGNAGFTAANAEERSECSLRKNLSLYWRKFYVELISLPNRGETGRDILTRTEIEPRPKKRAGDRIRTEYREVRDHLQLRADGAAEGEQAALSRLSKAEFHTISLLEEQRNQILSEARSEMHMQDFLKRQKVQTWPP